MPSLGLEVDIAYDDSGEADLQPVVFLHGLSMSRTSWTPIACELSGTYRVAGIDQRGHGESSHAPGTYDLEHYAADTAAFCEGVIGGPSVLVGHSLGGVIAAYLAQQRPDLVTAVYLEDPPLYRVGDDGARDLVGVGAMFPVALQLFTEMRERGASLEEYEALVRAAPALSGQGTVADGMGDGASAMAAAFHALDPQVFAAAIDGSAIRGVDNERPLGCPVRLVRADPALGPAFDPDHEERFLAVNPDATIVCFAGASHAIHDEQPERFIADLQSFLRSL